MLTKIATMAKITTISVEQLIEVLNEVENKDLPVFIAEWGNKELGKTKNGEEIYETEKIYGIVNGGVSPTAFILAFQKDNRIE